MYEILIVEDDYLLNKGLGKALTSDTCRPLSCLNIQSAREQLAVSLPSLILLDVNLPDGSGLSFLRELKSQHPTLPVILLTANDTDLDIVEGLEKGADDYITKPFSLAVLRARVGARLRHLEVSIKENGSQSQNLFQDKSLFKDGPFQFDFDRMVFTAEGKEVSLSKTEQKLLRLLTDHAGITLRRETLIDHIWTDGAAYVDENALSVAVKRLRDKLGAQDSIKTVYGIGYTWVKGTRKEDSSKNHKA